MLVGSKKVLPFEEAAAVFAELRAQGKTIVQCHGTFDLVHPGHIYHLEEAKAQGDVLVVTVTAERFVNKGPGRPYFNDHLRLKTLAALESVDYVVLVPYPAAVEVIRVIQPHIYVKGKEYADPTGDPTGNILDDVREVEKVGGRVLYLGSVVFSSTKLLNNHFDHLPVRVHEFARGLAAEFTPGDFRAALDSLADLRVLVLGDTIFDRYTSVRVQGLASKNRIMSGRYLGEELQCGGALAVFRHVRQFAPNVGFISLVGTEPWVEPLLREQLAPEADHVIRDSRFTTVVKQRFVEPRVDGKELSKLFSVNYLDAEPPVAETVARIQEQIQSAISSADVVLLADFGHGLMDEKVRRQVENNASFLALNCQTNSYNHGFNIISRQYRRADAFSLDAQEIMLACARRHLDYAAELSALRRELQARYAWLTRGDIETIGLRDGDACSCPPLEHEVVDTVGAGDAFFALASLAAAREIPLGLATLMGQLAGAQAVRIVGNAEPVSATRLLKSGMSLLNH